jgi:L-aminopeptidase/D-esterase-like protein
LERRCPQFAGRFILPGLVLVQTSSFWREFDHATTMQRNSGSARFDLSQQRIPQRRDREPCLAVGALVLSNFGRSGDLILRMAAEPIPKGSATDIPLDDRQLNRGARRAGAGIARLGSYWGHGSGDIAIAFTTADPLSHFSSSPFSSIVRLDDSRIDLVFEAVVEATAEAVVNALCAAESVIGRNGRRIPALTDWLKEAPRA